MLYGGRYFCTVVSPRHFDLCMLYGGRDFCSVVSPDNGLFVLFSIHVVWVGLDGFQSQISQNLS